ncbi:DinB family protein [Camelliibacillus cellulosilyticus]|uniref:DinB family protein n=1 Tax=Camelliibacillus cellulosilyticus TaxID=2174486 RepID=A0ABV9GIT1_9BACL
MEAKQTFHLFTFARKNTLKELDATSEAIADKMAEGFSNNIRWNFGHIVTVTESIVCRLAGATSELPGNYMTLFASGTSPKDWQGEVPSLKELREQLEKQMARIQNTFYDKLDNKTVEDFLGLETVRDAILFAIYHEGMHLGTIKGLKKGLQ